MFKRPWNCDTGSCVEVNIAREGIDAVIVRSSKGYLHGSVVFTKDEWRTFVRAVKNSEFDV